MLRDVKCCSHSTLRTGAGFRRAANSTFSIVSVKQERLFFWFSILSSSHIIALASAHSMTPWLRQSPGGLGAWAGNVFAPNEAHARTLVVYDDLAGDFITCAPRGRRILVIGEPPGIKTYKQEFLAQFGLILSPYAFETQDVPLRITQTGLPWFYGLRFEAGGLTVGQSFEDLVNARPGPKDHKISVVC